MPTINYDHRVGGVLTTSGTTPQAEVTRNDTEQIMIAATDMTEVTTGKYSYTFEDPEYELEYTIKITIGAQLQTTLEVSGESDLYYGNVTEGDNYFSDNIWADAWDGATRDQKKWAIKEATSRLDALAFFGVKDDADQSKQFPREGQDEIPSKIMEAMFDIALKLLDGYNPEEEIESLSVSGRSYAGARTTFDPESAGKPWIATGILSKNAWDKLIPYMLNQRALRMIRG